MRHNNNRIDLNKIWFGRERGMRYQAIKISIVSNRNEIASSSLIKQADAPLVQWEKFKYMVFDLPLQGLRDAPYATRYEYMKKLIPPGTKA